MPATSIGRCSASLPRTPAPAAPGTPSDPNGGALLVTRLGVTRVGQIHPPSLSRHAIAILSPLPRDLIHHHTTSPPRRFERRQVRGIGPNLGLRQALRRGDA